MTAALLKASRRERITEYRCGFDVARSLCWAAPTAARADTRETGVSLALVGAESNDVGEIAVVSNHDLRADIIG